MKQIVNKYKSHILLFLLIIVGIFAISQWFSTNKYKKLSTQYKEVMIEADTIPNKIDDGHYKQLVNDMAKSQRELMSILKSQNNNLFREMKEQRKQLIAVIATQQTFQRKIDTVFVDEDESFTDYYPGKDDWFIQYDSKKIDNDHRIGDWNFSDLDLDLTISEKQPGIFEANLSGPSFIKVNKLQVNSLPLQNIKVDNFGWTLGGSLDWNFIEQKPGVEVVAGFRVKKNNYFIKGRTDQSVGVGLIHEF